MLTQLLPMEDEEPEIVADLPPALREAFDGYTRGLADAELSDNTRRVYRSRVSNFLSWLTSRADQQPALTDPHARNAVVQDYQRYLNEQGRTASAVNAIRVAVDDFYRHLGLGSAVASRRRVTPTPPPALEPDALAALDAALAAAAADDAPRRRAVIQLMRYAGLNGAEVAALDVSDVDLTGEPGVRVHGARARTVPLHPELVAALRAWRRIRDTGTERERSAALFPNRSGRHLSARSITGIVQEAGELAGVPLSPDRLRATFAASLRQVGADAAVVAALTGRRITEHDRPAAPSATVLRAAVRRVPATDGGS
jgi:site-specific recombinase XerD